LRKEDALLKQNLKRWGEYFQEALLDVLSLWVPCD